MANAAEEAHFSWYRSLPIGHTGASAHHAQMLDQSLYFFLGYR
jgi:hypothetical protein